MNTSNVLKEHGSYSSSQKSLTQNIASHHVLNGGDTNPDDAVQLLDYGISAICRGLVGVYDNAYTLTQSEGMPQSLIEGFANFSNFYKNLAREIERKIEDGNLSCNGCDLDEGYGEIMEFLGLLAAKGELGKMLAATFYVKFARKVLHHISCQYSDEIRYQQMALVDEIDYLLCSVLGQMTEETCLTFEAEIYRILILFENNAHPHWLGSRVLAYLHREDFQQPFFLRSLTLLRHRNNQRVAKLLPHKVAKGPPPRGLPQELVDLVELYLIDDGREWWRGTWLECHRKSIKLGKQEKCGFRGE